MRAPAGGRLQGEVGPPPRNRTGLSSYQSNEEFVPSRAAGFAMLSLAPV